MGSKVSELPEQVLTLSFDDIIPCTDVDDTSSKAESTPTGTTNRNTYGQVYDLFEESFDTVYATLSDVTDLGEDLVELQGVVETLVTDLNTAESNISTLQTDLNTAESAIDALELSVSTAESNISTLQTDLGTAESEIDTLQTDLGTAQSDISTLQTDLGTAQSDISALDGRLDTAESDIDTLESGKIPTSYLDTDVTLAANSNTKIATQAAVKAYADALIAAANASVYKGVIDCSANPNYPAADAGWTYVVSVAGKIGGSSGLNVEAGDMLICLTDSTASGNQATVGADWNVIQKNLDGAVIGPASSVDQNFARFSGTGGKTIEDSGLNAASFVAANAGISPATGTKLTVDSKGLVTTIANATTADINDSADRRYCTDAEKTVIAATSGSNTGDQNIVDDWPIAVEVVDEKSPLHDNDFFGLVDSESSNELKSIRFGPLKSNLKSYFDTLYSVLAHTHTLSTGATDVSATAAELNLCHTITAGTVSASKYLLVDSNKDLTGLRRLSLDRITLKQRLDTYVTATDSSTTNYDWSAGSRIQHTMGGSRTITFSNAEVGQSIRIMQIQDGTGGRIPTWPTIAWDGGVTPDPTTAIGARDTYLIECVAASTYIGYQTGVNI